MKEEFPVCVLLTTIKVSIVLIKQFEVVFFIILFTNLFFVYTAEVLCVFLLSFCPFFFFLFNIFQLKSRCFLTFNFHNFVVRFLLMLSFLSWIFCNFLWVFYPPSGNPTFFFRCCFLQASSRIRTSSTDVPIPFWCFYYTSFSQILHFTLFISAPSIFYF